MANAWILRPLPIVSAVASATSVGDASYVGNDYAGVIWRSAGDAPTLTLDLGMDLPVDTIMLFGLSGFATNAQVKVALATAAQGSSFAAGSSWSVTQSVYAGTVFPTSGRGVMLWSAPAAGGPPAAVRYVQLTFSGLGGGQVPIARAVVGKRLQFERNFSYGAAFGVRDLGSLDFSRRGVLLRARGAKLRTVGLTFSSVRKDELEIMVRPLLELAGNTELVALVTDPDADAQRMNRCYLGALVGDLSMTRRTAVANELKINLVSIF